MNKYKIFLINLKKDSDRLSFMSKQFTELELNFIVQEGIDGQKYDFSNIDETIAKNKGTTILAIKGCALSHKLALENFLRDGVLDYTLVCEDDIELPKNFKIIIENEIKKRDQKITNWEYLSFNYPTVGLKFIKLWLFLLKNMFNENRSPSLRLKAPLFLAKFVIIVFMTILERLREIIYTNVYKYGKPALFYRPLYLAGCYLVNRRGAEKLLSLNNKLQYAADRLPNVARIKNNLKYYAYVPLLVKQRREKFGSNITGNPKDSFKF